MHIKIRVRVLCTTRRGAHPYRGNCLAWQPGSCREGFKCGEFTLAGLQSNTFRPNIPNWFTNPEQGDTTLESRAKQARLKIRRGRSGNETDTHTDKILTVYARVGRVLGRRCQLLFELHSSVSVQIFGFFLLFFIFGLGVLNGWGRKQNVWKQLAGGIIFNNPTEIASCGLNKSSKQKRKQQHEWIAVFELRCLETLEFGVSDQWPSF